MKKTVVFLVLTAVFYCVGAQAFAETSLALKDLEEAFVSLHEKVRPCVVNIDIKGAASEQAIPPDIFHFFFNQPTPDGAPKPPMPEGAPQQRMPRPQGTGSGFILDKEGNILTNNHVVAEAEVITVRLYNGNEYEAKVVGVDPDTDLAVIKIEAKEDLPVARLGNSDELKVGKFAIAMGSPRGFEGSLSFGHISALGRDKLNELGHMGLRFQNLIQTDAAINLGNSGGPLCNIDGEVIGINVAIIYGANNIGFAIPINTAKEVIPDLISTGKVVRGYLGVGIKDAREFAEAESMGLPDNDGALVIGVEEGTPAKKAGLQVYDVIRKVNDVQVKSAMELIRQISSYDPGATVTLEVWRDRKLETIDVELAQWDAKTAQHMPDKGHEALGMTVSGITPDMRERLQLESSVEGVIITKVAPGGPAEDARLMEGDIIIEIAQQPVKDAGDFSKLIEANAQPGKSLLLRYMRGAGNADITVLRVPKK